MDKAGESKQDGHRHLTKSRVMGKLFGKEKKASNDDDISTFLQGSSDKLYMTGAPPPVLGKIDTSRAPRWPTPAEINTRSTSRARSTSPKRSRRGLIVRFTDTQPEIIGEGGDEAEAPPLSISQFRKRSHSHPPMAQQTVPPVPERAATTRTRQVGAYANASSSPNDFRPPPIRRTQTGISDVQLPPVLTLDFEGEDRGGSRPANLLKSEPDPSSFAARIQAEMNAAEGKALLHGSPSTSIDSATSNSLNTPLTIRTGQQSSPSYALSQLTPGVSRTSSKDGSGDPQGKTSPLPKSPAHSLNATVVAVGADTIKDFSSRVKHLFKLFELSAESVKPIGSVALEDFVRAALWWFLKGRTNVEAAARSRPSSSEGQISKNHLLQQGHTHLAKCLWIIEEVVPRSPELKSHQIDDLTELIDEAKSTKNDYLADALERCQVIISSLQKLSISMKRNELLPPPAEEAILPQGLDTTIWINYPSFTPDIPDLLSGRPGGALGSQTKHPPTRLSYALPLGDTQEIFLYNRMYVDLYLMEERVESQQFRCPCVLSIFRRQTDKGLTIVVASQIDLVTMSVQSDKTRGPTWNDLKWRTANSNIEIKLPRGFIAVVQFSPGDFKILWNMYDYTLKVQAGIQPRRNEQVIFDKTLEAVQYFDRDPQSRIFPKEPVPNCQVRILEKRITEVEGTGARIKHRGYRIAVVTHTKTKQLNGIFHDLPTSKPTQYGFMRGDSGAPALLLKFDDLTQKSTLVLNFDDIEDRALMYNCITGGAQDYEVELASLPIKKYMLSSISATSASPKVLEDSTLSNALDSFEWGKLRVINRGSPDGSDPEHSPAVLSESLRIIVEARNGSITDRINVTPGELKVRVATEASTHEITLLREPQEDMNISVLEAQVPRELPGRLTELLSTAARNRTLHKYCFSNTQDLHKFQAAITGFSVLFDGLTESYAISRRRMVVPIYKKLEASTARIQLLRHEKVIQLAAFFEGFAHGECMNFAMKATDVFESFNRGNKFCVRIVDAKFAAPKCGDERGDGVDNGFICLDMPDYPGEHDDITIGFNSEADRDRFAEALPSPVKVLSRLTSVRR